jgi:WD40 repeat protein
LRLLSKDDIFISYSRRDGGAYAAGLADKLTQKGFSCFIDKLGTEPNHDLPESLKKKIRNCSIFLLVGTECGAASQFVRQEVAEFLKTRRTIVPVDFDGAVGRACWYNLIPGLAPEPERNPEALANGEPSANVVSRVEKSFNYTRRNRLMLRLFWLTLTTVLILVIAGLSAAYWAGKSIDKANQANDDAAKAREQKDQAQSEAADAFQQKTSAIAETNRQREAARVAADLAEQQRKLAAANATTARERLINLSQEQGRLELLRGNRPQALVYLSDAYTQRTADEALRFLVAMAKRSLVFTFQTGGANARLRDAATAGSLDLGFGLELYDVAFSPDGKRVVTAAEDGTIVWDPLNGHRVATIPEKAFSAAFIAKGKYVLTRQARSRKLWNPETGTLVRALPDLQMENDPVAVVGEFSRLSRDEKRLALPSADLVLVFDLESGRLLYSLQNPAGTDAPLDGRTSVAFSPDGTRILTLHKSFAVSVWDAANGRLLHRLDTQGERIETAGLSPDGRQIVTAGEPAAVKIWDTESGKLAFTLPGHTQEVHAAAFSPDGSLLATAGFDNSIRIWDRRIGFHLLRTLDDPPSRVTSLAFSPNSRRLVAVSKEATPESGAKVWDVDEGQTLESFEGQVNAALFSPDGEHVLLTNSKDEVKIWNIRKDLFIDRLLANAGPGSAVAFSPNGRHLLASNGDGKVLLWETAPRRLLRVFETHKTILPSGTSEEPVGAHVTSASFSPDGKRVVIPLLQAGAGIWDIDRGQQIQSLPGSAGQVISVAFSPDGLRIVTTSTDDGGRRARVWDAKSGRLLRELVDEQALHDAFFSPDGKLILTASRHGGKIWNALTGVPVRKIFGESFSFSPDGRSLLAVGTSVMIGGGGLRHSAILTDLESGNLLHELSHPQSVASASFSRDGQQIVTASWDQKARIWDTATGKMIQVLGGHTGPLLAASFSPDGGRIVTTGKDRSMKIWDAARAQVLVSLTSPSEENRVAAFSPDGNYLISLGAAPDTPEIGSIRLWDVHTEARKPAEIARLVDHWTPVKVFDSVVRQAFR